MTLTEVQKQAREGKLTASRVACLMTGDKAKIYALWREMCGDPTYVEENLDEIWYVQLGAATEHCNLDWYARRSGNAVGRRGEVIAHPHYSWASSTLDGFVDNLPGPIETKHVNGFEKWDSVVAKYMPQCHWQMECTGTRKCALSVIEGARQPRIELIEYDKDYADELMSRALRFMEHVWNMTEPVILEERVLERISRAKDYNMVGNNHWAAYAGEWLSHKEAAKKWKDAEEKLREMVPSDARECTGYGITIRRDRANRLSIRSTDDGTKNKSKR